MPVASKRSNLRFGQSGYRKSSWLGYDGQEVVFSCSATYHLATLPDAFMQILGNSSVVVSVEAGQGRLKIHEMAPRGDISPSRIAGQQRFIKAKVDQWVRQPRREAHVAHPRLKEDET